MGSKILIVDDEREIADVVALYLQNENYDVYKFYSAPCSRSRRKSRIWRCWT